MDRKVSILVPQQDTGNRDVHYIWKVGHAWRVPNLGQMWSKDLPLKVFSRWKGLGVDFRLTTLLYTLNLRPPFLLSTNSLSLLSTSGLWVLFLRRASNNKVSVWLSLDLWWNQDKFKAMTILSFSPLVSLLEYPTVTMKFQLKELCIFYSVHWVRSTIWKHCKGHRSTEVFKARSFQYLLISLRLKHNTGHSCSCRNKDRLE